MKIEVKQVKSSGGNEFEVRYNDQLQYRAVLPFVSINDPFNLEKVREIKIFDISGNQVYKTDYGYIENFKEEFIPLKYLVTGSQKFNQLLFISNDKTIKVYYESKELFNSRYVIEIGDKKYLCYSIEDGYIRHFPIYDGDIQVGEALKSNVVVDAKDEYVCYLKDGYESLSDGIVSLLLYLDRGSYSSSYIVNKSYTLEKKFSYNKTNKFYDKEWVKNNFGDEYYRKVDNDVVLVKEKLKHPMKTWKEQQNSMSQTEKSMMNILIILPIIIIIIVGIIILVAFLGSN